MQYLPTMRRSNLLLLVACSTLVFSGCGKDTNKANAKASAPESDGSAASRCQTLLTNGMSRLDPSNLGVTSKPASAALGLNDWFRRCGQDNWSSSWREELAEMLPPEMAERASANQFSDSDSLHLRTSRLMRAYAETVQARSEVDQIVGVFYAIIRDISLQERDLPLTPFEIIMTGRGTAMDRAWVFASALRQLRIDAVILTSSTNESAWLVGVVSDAKVLLFDMNLGLPVFNVNEPLDGLLPSTPATLKSLAEEGEILGSLSVDGHPYPAKDDDFNEVQVHLVGEAGVFAQRSLLLQKVLSGDAAAVFCDPIQDIDDTPGLMSRVSRGGEWDADQLKIWDYPVTQLDEFSHLSESDQAKLTNLMSPMQARVLRKRVEDQLVFSTPYWELFVGRVDQLSGGVGDASISTRYQNIRLGKLEAVSEVLTDKGRKVSVRSPDEFVDMHNRAAEDAAMWVSVNHYRVEGYGPAINGLYSYRRAYPEGTWIGHAEYILALALAESGNITKGVEYMAKAAEASELQAAGNQLLHELWAKNDPSSEPVPAKEDPVPAKKEMQEENKAADAEAKDDEEKAKEEMKAKEAKEEMKAKQDDKKEEMKSDAGKEDKTEEAREAAEQKKENADPGKEDPPSKEDGDAKKDDPAKADADAKKKAEGGAPKDNEPAL